MPRVASIAKTCHIANCVWHVVMRGARLRPRRVHKNGIATALPSESSDNDGITTVLYDRGAGDLPHDEVATMLRICVASNS